MALSMGKGFLGFSHYGHPCFIREEYEEAHLGENELERLEDTLGLFFSDMDMALYHCLSHAKYLLYRLQSDDIDNELLKGKDPWISYKGGYVHIVTGEFVTNSIKPSFDSYPCWKKEEPLGSYFNPTSGVQLSGLLGVAASLFSFLAYMMGEKR